MHERLKTLRKKMKLSQKAFGLRIGVSESAISNIESGRYNITETVCKLICREFNVNENWLRSGHGKTFIQTNNDEFEQFTQKHNLRPYAKEILRFYLTLDHEKQTALEYLINDYVEHCKIIAKLHSEKEPEKLLNGLTKDEYIKQAAQEAKKQAEMDWEQAKKGENQDSPEQTNTA